MNNNDAIITYLYNSGFTVETKNHMLIFDYCLDKSDNNEKDITAGVINPAALEFKRSIAVFVSHSHSDHFNAIVLRWQVKRKDIKYIFSNDVPIKKSAILIKEGETLVVSDMKVRALPSTDVGVSFLVEVDGLTIFHAGDLNLWNWQEDYIEDQKRFEFFSRRAMYAFQKALLPLQNYRIDIAFFPVDPKIGSKYFAGALYFIEHFHPKLFVPMHFGRKYSVCEEIQKRIDPSGINVFLITKRGDQYEYKALKE